MNEQLEPPKKRTALGGDYYILTLGLPSVLVECGFLSNAKEERKLLDEEYRGRLRSRLLAGRFGLAVAGAEKPGSRCPPWTEAASRTIKH